MTSPAHLYVHVPFCASKCDYCALYSVPWDAAAGDAYLDALDEELRGATFRNVRPRTLYCGGGTPTCLSAPQLARLCRDILGRWAAPPPVEWTLEANPASLTDEKLAILRDAGVNRVSLGAQVLDDAGLRGVGRRHDAADVARAVAAARAGGIGHVGLDLIAGLPGTTAAVWERTLARVVALAPDHVSVYGLAVEPGTRLACAVRAAAWAPSGEGVQLAALRRAQAVLGSAGYRRYEISNYARPGCACRHNLNVWQGGDYLGAGPGAASRVGLRRWTHTADLAGYTAALRAGGAPPRAEETLTPATDVAERFIFAFRCTAGIDLDAFCTRFGAPAAAQRPGWERRLAVLTSQGLVAADGCQWRLTPRGREVADAVMAELT